MTISESVTHGIVTMHNGLLMQGELNWKASDPYAVIARFPTSNENWIEWRFDIELLRVGMNTSSRLVGQGDVRTRRYDNSLVMVLSNQERSSMVLIPTTQVARFLRNVKPVELNFDSELDELLKGSADEG